MAVPVPTARRISPAGGFSLGFFRPGRPILSRPDWADGHQLLMTVRMVTKLTRTVRFSAGHHYYRSDWTPERNRSTFGDSIQPHGHNYEVLVTVAGSPDPETGFVIDLAAFDALLDESIRRPFHQRDLNASVSEFHSGRLQPSTESLAALIWSRIAPAVPGGAMLDRVVVRESDQLEAEVVRAP